MAGKAGQVGRKKDPKTRASSEASGCLIAPAWLEGEARDVFFDVAEILTKEYEAGEVDSHAVAMYAYNYVLLVSLRDCPLTDTTTNGNTVQHPKLAIRNKAQDMVLRYQKELGMTPKARAALPVKVGDEKDEFSDFE